MWPSPQTKKQTCLCMLIRQILKYRRSHTYVFALASHPYLSSEEVESIQLSIPMFYIMRSRGSFSYKTVKGWTVLLWAWLCWISASALDWCVNKHLGFKQFHQDTRHPPHQKNHTAALVEWIWMLVYLPLHFTHFLQISTSSTPTSL